MTIDPGKRSKSETLAPLTPTPNRRHSASSRGSGRSRPVQLAMSKTVATGFHSRTTHFITAENGARRKGASKAPDPERDGRNDGTKGAEGGGRKGSVREGPWYRRWPAALLSLTQAKTPAEPPHKSLVGQNTRLTHHTFSPETTAWVCGTDSATSGSDGAVRKAAVKPLRVAPDRPTSARSWSIRGA